MNSGMGGGNSGGSAGAAERSQRGSSREDGFAPSALGTREHWDAVYEREPQTFQEYGDTGEIWFGEASMNWLIRRMQKHKIPLVASVLDNGTRNGVFLVELVGTFSIHVLNLDLEQATQFLWVQCRFFPKAFDKVILIGFFSSKLWKRVCIKER
uniref:EEF1A lysine methyltransferase 2 n=1 Tax=Ursus americanus TaxID=9643 RepID=A0A452S1S9_URSAM